MNIFTNNIKRILKKKLNIIFMLVVPTLLISFMSLVGGFDTKIKAGVVDYDGTDFTALVIESIMAEADVEYINEDEIQKKLFNVFIDMAVVIEKGFTVDVINGMDTSISILSLKETNKSASLKIKLEGFMDAALNIASSAKGDISKFYEGMKLYQQGMVKTEYEVLSDEKGSAGTTKQQMGFLVMGMLFLASLASMIMIEDKENKTYFRVLSAPVKVSSYMLQNILSFFIIAVIQILLLFFFMSAVLGVDFGSILPAMIVVSIIFSLVCVALGAAINTFSKDLRQSGLFISLLLSPMCMLGGCWWPIEFMPEFLRKIALFVPTTWIMQAYDKLLYGKSLMDTKNEMLVLLGFALVFFLFSSWKKADVAK